MPSKKQRMLESLYQILIEKDTATLFNYLLKPSFVKLLKSHYKKCFNKEAPLFFELCLLEDDQQTHSLVSLIFSRIKVEKMRELLETNDDKGNNFLHYAAKFGAFFIFEHLFYYQKSHDLKIEELMSLSKKKDCNGMTVLEVLKQYPEAGKMEESRVKRWNTILKTLTGESCEDTAALLFRRHEKDYGKNLVKVEAAKMDKI